MVKNKIEIPAAAVLLILLCICGHVSSEKTYIVKLKTTRPFASLQDRHEFYTTSLESMDVSETQQVYNYKNINLCSISLTEEQAQQISTNENVEFMIEEQKYELHTTRAPLFLGMEEPNAAAQLSGIDKGSQVVVGVLDTGVWPESPSFNDDHMGPVPAKFYGKCDVGIKCNKKLVGAMAFYKGYQQALQGSPGPKDLSPRDTEGHGTHTSSTVGGSRVLNASLFGFARGEARGMLQSARIAVYKVCWPEGCLSSDILAGIDQAIEDNVDIISMSLGGPAGDLYKDVIAIGAFHAMQKGILVSCSAGNSGPGPSSVTNVAPWIFTVGAGTLDRDFPAFVKLGNNNSLAGVSLYRGHLRTKLPMVYARDVSKDGNTSQCLNGTLVHDKVKGKIVLCERGVNARAAKGAVVRDAGGLGMVLFNDPPNGDELVADAHVIPTVAVGHTMGEQIKKYLASAGNKAMANFRFQGTKLGIPAPLLAAFSSRGPNPINQDILKPDIIAPGVNILAAWTGEEGPTGLPVDKRRVKFNIISGTSMSCPIVSGLAAVLKAAHPGWSPAAIRSALMTTAYNEDTNGKQIVDSATGKPATAFQTGAGHARPMAALDPGLVYDISPSDYSDFLCALNYSPQLIQRFIFTDFTCDKKKNYRVSDLNYPSFAVSVEEASQKGGVTQTRTLTNVGKPGTYKVSVVSPSSAVKITVEPQTLTFSKPNQKESYTVTFTVASKMQAGTNLFGRIEWSDDMKHLVGSPIAFSSAAKK